jgi:predicted ArsR family transcriptional regulator
MHEQACRSRGMPMTKIRGDPIQISLAHPTRNALYSQLASAPEMSTVQLCKAVGVERYHLYHHLKHLVKVGLIENHRAVGRARWWKCIQQVSLETSQETSALAASSGAAPAWVSNIDSSLREMLEKGATIKMVNLSGNASDSISIKKSIEQLAQDNGLDFDLPFTFIPAAVAVISRSR